ncbi:MAG: MazG family protein [Actinobacteria bacterium]|jgi:XTP/dITP diphosphohydrolase|nr:MazG family protein [Actinomycetota bacterium]
MPEPGDGLSELVAVMDRLRSPGGCPWDARQTHRSLAEYLLEEAYETVEAIESGDRDDLREELGDLLLQVAFHARIAEEDPDDPWDIDDVARGIVAKLVRRHPHVFAGDAPDVTTAEQVESRWHELKAREKGRASVTEGIPEALPALLRASKMLARSEHLDVALPDAGEPLAGVTTEGSFGDLLLVLVAAGRARGWDAEAALRDAVRRQATRIRDAEEG